MHVGDQEETQKRGRASGDAETKHAGSFPPQEPESSFLCCEQSLTPLRSAQPQHVGSIAAVPIPPLGGRISTVIIHGRHAS
ncbi:hypothetical protein CapIbe_023896 [Capra ibex]